MTTPNDQLEVDELAKKNNGYPVDYLPNKALSVQFDSTVLADEISGLIDDLEGQLDPVLMPDNGTVPGITDGESSVMSSFYVIKQRLEKLKQRIHV